MANDQLAQEVVEAVIQDAGPSAARTAQEAVDVVIQNPGARRMQSAHLPVEAVIADYGFAPVVVTRFHAQVIG